MIKRKIPLDKYKKSIEEHINDKKSGSLKNIGKEYALALMQFIFEESKEEIKIFAKGLGGELASDPEYIDSLKQFIERKGKIKVLVESDNYKNQEGSALNFLINEFKKGNKNIECRLLNNGTPKKIYSHFEIFNSCNFLIGDDEISRIETNPKNFKAIAHFHNKNRVVKLNEIFDNYFIDKESISLNVAC